MHTTLESTMGSHSFRPAHAPGLSLAAIFLSAAWAFYPGSALAQGPTEEDTWKTLSSVRESLAEAGPTRAAFTQTFIPAGFSTGDVERGTLALDLPDCLRWDYSEPYAKAFLLCGDTAYLWNPGDPTGRRYTVDRRREPGLDLVLLSVGELRQRYQVAGETGPEDRLDVRLTPRDSTGELVEARLEIDVAERRVVSLATTDDEGNVTRFEIGGYGPLPEDGIFTAPSDIEWTQDEP